MFLNPVFRLRRGRRRESFQNMVVWPFDGPQGERLSVLRLLLLVELSVSGDIELVALVTRGHVKYFMSYHSGRLWPFYLLQR